MRCTLKHTNFGNITIIKPMGNKNNWRLIRSGHNSGAWNMALDEALLESYLAQHRNNEKPLPIIRFYSWQPACLSLGYAQRAEREVDFDGCTALAIDWVRRPTGGRAILHESSELTYSVIATGDEPGIAGGILESYRRISNALLIGLKNLGIEASLAGKENAKVVANTAACFDAPSAYEVTYQGRKVIGSAQARRGDGMLQQGTILVSVDMERLFTALKPPPRLNRTEAIEQVGARLISISQILGSEIAFEEIEKAFISGFAEGLGVNLLEDTVTSSESELATRLVTEKYNNPAWNMTRQRPSPIFH
jgi:lipoate-protein ligase A